VLDLPDRPTWMQHAACRGEDPNLFFPDRSGDWTTPLAICARCPVTTPCLEWALDNHESAGIYGNTTGKARRQIRRARNLTAQQQQERSA
jgi:WhiB family redox-sensing transcriptional regulator